MTRKKSRIVIAVVLFMLFGWLGARPYFAMQSNVAETVEGGTVYIAICCIGSLGIFIEVLGERLLQSTGRTVYTMISQGMGAVVNIILDPIFIHGWFGVPAMGVAGAAVATVISQWFGAVLVVIFNLKFNPEVQFGLKYLKPRKHIIGSVLTVGIPSIIMNGIGSIMNFGMNQILQGFQETATGVFGIYFKLQSFFFMPLFGINNATISIIAYNYGARKPERITKTLKIACCVALTLMVAGLLCFQLIPDVLLGLFNSAVRHDPVFATASQSYLISFAFATGLCPIAGTYGWKWGAAAGFISGCIFTQKAATHGGLMLFNGGFAAGLTAMILIPVLEFYRVKYKE